MARVIASGLAAVAKSSGGMGPLLERTASYLATHKKTRWAANALLTASAAVAAAAAAVEACSEEVLLSEPRRSRCMPPRWLEGHLPLQFKGHTLISSQDLFKEVPGLQQQWAAAGRQLERVQAGEVHFTWLEPREGEEGALRLPPAQRRMVEAAARAAAAAARAEAEEARFGTHVLEWGLHVVVTPSKVPRAVSLPGVIVVSAGDLQGHLRYSSTAAEGVAAIMGTFAHEAAHLVYRHGYERRLDGVPGAALNDYLFTKRRADAYLASASERAQQLNWAYEFEADLFAAACLMRLQVPLEQVAASLRADAQHIRAVSEEFVQWAHGRLAVDKEVGRRVLAHMLGCAPPDVERELQRLRDPAARERYNRRQDALDLGAEPLLPFQANQAEQPAAAASAEPTRDGRAAPAAPGTAAEAEGSSATAVVASAQCPRLVLGSPVLGTAGHTVVTQAALERCPQAARTAYLMALASTHPPVLARIARLGAAARSPALLRRYAKPPVAVGGAYYPGRSVAEVLADRLAAEQAEEAARVAAAQELAALGHGKAALERR